MTTITTTWLLRQHLSAVAAIDPEPLDERGYRRFLNEPQNGGIVATDGQLVYGFALYGRYPDHLQIEKLAVCSEQADFVESLLMLSIKWKCKDRRTFVAHIAHEADLQEQLRYQRHGFMCVDIWREFFGEDAGYVFRWERPIAPTEPAMGATLDKCGVNRIKAML